MISQKDYKKLGFTPLSYAPDTYTKMVNESGVPLVIITQNSGLIEIQLIEDDLLNSNTTVFKGKCDSVEFLEKILKATYIDNTKDFDCYNCIHSFMNPFDQYYCSKEGKAGRGYDIEKGKHCHGVHYKKK